MEPLLIDGILRGVEGETRHICWECPVCGWRWSDDYEPGDMNPLTISCDRRRHHPNGNQITVLVRWSPEALRNCLQIA